MAVVYCFFCADAGPGVPELIDHVADEGDEADALAEELIVEDGGVFVDGDEVGGEHGDFGDHDSAEGVG